MRLRDVAAAYPLDGEAGLDGLDALLAHGLALARRERAQEVIEGGVAGIAPVELLVGALEEAPLAQPIPFALACERDVQPRQVAALDEPYGGLGKTRLVGGRIGTGPRQQPAPGNRRERNGDLQLGVIAPAGPLVGIGPGSVEDVFALAV